MNRPREFWIDESTFGYPCPGQCYRDKAEAAETTKAKE